MQEGSIQDWHKFVAQGDPKRPLSGNRCKMVDDDIKLGTR